MRMHARAERFAKQDLSILISATAMPSHTDKEEKTQGTLCFFNSLNPPEKKVLLNMVMQYLFLYLNACNPIQRQI